MYISILKCVSFCLILGFAGLSVQGQILSNDSINRVDAKGMKQGYWKKIDPARSLSYEGYFVNDMPHGRFVYRNKIGEIQIESDFFRDGYASFTRIYYPKTGKIMSEGYYLDKQKDSVWRFYSEQGLLLKEEFYKQNLLNGTSYLFDEKGRIMETQEWFRGLRNGKWWQRSQKGTQITTYLLNKSHGEYKAFYPDSSLYISGMYNDGLKEGDWSFYLAGGHKYKKDSYKNNELVDREVYVSTNGKTMPILIDTIAAITIENRTSVMYSTHGARLEVDQLFPDLCTIFDTDYFFYANKTTFVSIRMVKDLKILDAETADVILKCRLPFKIQVEGDAFRNIRSLLDTAKVN